MAKKSWSKWTDDTLEKFKEMYPFSSWDELLQEFPFTKGSMMQKASELGISRKSSYSKQEDEEIMKCYSMGMTDSEIAERLPGRTA